MHDQAYLRKKAGAQYNKFLLAWLIDEAFFPLSLSLGTVDVKNYAALDSAVDTLHRHSKAIIGYGYIVESETRRTRNLGQQTIPHHIVFETAEDYLRYLGDGKLHQFKHFVADVGLVRATFPQLDNWLQDNIKEILKYHGQWEDLLRVCQFFLENPQPQRYSRELPVEVHTKFIENHQSILDKLLQEVLPDSSYDLHAEDFNTRYGIRKKSSLVRIRLLDDALKSHGHLLFDDFAIPVTTLQTLPLSIARCVIVENELNFLTFPPLDNSICIWGEGFKANLLREVHWLGDIDIVYWGDIDVQGFQILSTLRSHFPHVRSILMDQETYDRFQQYKVTGQETKIVSLFNLTGDERNLYQYLLENNCRLEQEHISHNFVKATLQREV